ncbi:MAG TPA: acylphosphatase [Ktedonobacterales bacterium]|jgi:acylphosphatase
MDQREACAQLRAIVRGQVQGVGFRMWAQRRARMLGISGYVRNLADGSVEILGEGSRETLEQLLGVLRLGPEGANVRSVQVTWDRCASVSDRFEIRR